MSVLQLAYKGTVRKYPCLSTILSFIVVVGLAWRFVLRPEGLIVVPEAVHIHSWNVSQVKVTNEKTMNYLTSSSTVEFSLQNPSLCWRLHIRQAQIFLMLLTPHFRYPLAISNMTGFLQHAHSRKLINVELNNTETPLLYNAKFMHAGSGAMFGVSFESNIIATPHAWWFWVPYEYKQQLNCKLHCSLTNSTSSNKHKMFKLTILDNQCGLS